MTYTDVQKITHVQIVRLSVYPLSATMNDMGAMAGIAAVSP